MEKLWAAVVAPSTDFVIYLHKRGPGLLMSCVDFKKWKCRMSLSLKLPMYSVEFKKWSCHYDFQAPVVSLLKAACLLSVTCRCDDCKGLDPYKSTTVLIPHSRERVPYNYVNKNTHRYSSVSVK